MASSTEEQIHQRVSDSTGTDATWMSIGPISDQERQIRADVHRVTSHPLVPDSVEVGGFIYDVDTGLLNQVV
jgi:carbonic anhydrase